MSRLPSLALIALTFDFGPVNDLEKKAELLGRLIASTNGQKAVFEAIMSNESLPMWQRQEAAAVCVELQNKMNKLFADENEIRFMLDEFERDFGAQMSSISVGDA